eukprot:1186047-Rhodomonas_salina.2
MTRNPEKLEKSLSSPLLTRKACSLLSHSSPGGARVGGGGLRLCWALVSERHDEQEDFFIFKNPLKSRYTPCTLERRGSQRGLTVPDSQERALTTRNWYM